jgi:vancomycin resistance protein YoaR
VAPGETFSFNTNLGAVDEAHGFKQAYVIKQGRTEMDVGGGICQVSTTLFRAILNSGLNIIARQNHAYRVRYYEEDMPPGYDATVFYLHLI